MSPDTSLAMVFMFDADTAGVDARLTSIRREIADAMEIHLDAVAILSNGACCAIKGLCVGCLVLTDESLETGKLEDVLLPLMRKENEGIFASAEDFIDGHFDVERTKFLRIRLKEGALYEARGSDKDFDRKKSLIGVVAQLQISGKPNQACINRTDYLNMSKLTTAPVTAPIRKFIETITNFT